MKPEYEGLLRSVTQWSHWTYKGQRYQIMTVTPGLLSQDHELDEWCPTVIYIGIREVEKGSTHIAKLDLRFARPITEFVRKFEKVES